MGRHGAPTLLKNLDSFSRSGGLYIGDGVRGWTLASIPAQEFGEGTRPDDGRSTTSCSSRQRRSRATSPRATMTHQRVRLFATVTSLLRPRSITCCSSRRRRELATSLRASAWAPIPAQEPGGGMYWMCWMGRRQVGWKSTSLCDILLPLLSTAFDSPRTHPCSRIWTVDHSFLARQHRQAEEYASSRLSPRSCAPGRQPAALRDEHASTMPSRDPLATPSLLKKLDSSWAGSTVPRTQTRGWPRAPIPTQEFGGWMRWMV